MTNPEIAAILKQIAVYQELSGENPFKARAFENAGRQVERHPESVEAMAREDRLNGIKGVGSSIAEIIKEIAAAGKSPLLEELRAACPPGLTGLLELPGLGPKRVRRLWQGLGITDLGELEYACRENRLLSLEGFGEKSQEKILSGIAFRRRFQEMHLFSEALAAARGITAALAETGLFTSIEIAGSLRRGKRILKDIDVLLVAGPDSPPAQMQEALTGLADRDPGIPGVTGAGETKVSIRRQGLQVDFRLVPAPSRAAALQHFTGSREHNTLLRRRAKAMGLKSNEYGLFRGEEALELPDEEAVYRGLGLAWIPPEIREGGEEVEAAERGQLPALVEAADLKGMIHVHSTYSDGVNSIEELARECERLGYQYLCLSDHSRSAGYAGGLSAERLIEQGREVVELNRRLAPFRIFHGIESDILADGSLDYPDDVLAKLDFVIGSIHSHLSMGSKEATERLLRAVRHPRLTILGHASGALLLSRQGYEYDAEKLFAAMAEHGKALEHNCNPHRLDPDWPLLQQAGRLGVRVALGPDAHSLEGLRDMSYGVIMARKAWLARTGLLNCLDREEIHGFFKEGQG